MMPENSIRRPAPLARRSGALFALGLLCALPLLGGCFKLSVNYPPQPPRPAFDRFVSLRITDARTLKRPKDRAVLGRVRGGYGNPIAVRERREDAVPLLVHDAMVDALGRAGIGVREGAPTVLDVQIRRFWMDGYVGYTANIEADCALSGPQGAGLWQSPVAGQRAGAVVWNAGREVRRLLTDTLLDFSAKAAYLFNNPAFQQHVSRAP